MLTPISTHTPIAIETAPEAVPEIAAPDAAPTPSPQVAGAAPRRPRLIDHLLLSATPWSVAPQYQNNASPTARFIQNVRAELLEGRTFVMVADAASEFLASMPHQSWDLTRDIPNAKPAGDIVLWEWRTADKNFTGALCKSLVKRSLGAALEDLGAIQETHFDYDVALVLESANKAKAFMPSADQEAPVIFLAGTVLKSHKPVPDPRRPKAPLTEVRPLGSFALTLRADGRPAPGTLALILWDDETAPERVFHTAPLQGEIYDAITELLVMHTLIRSPLAQTVTAPAQTFQGRADNPFHGVGLANYFEIELGSLPQKLREEGFAESDGLKKALFYMGGHFASQPIRYPD